MNIVKVKFSRKDIFNKFFNEEFINSNKEIIAEFGRDFISLRDDIIDNEEADSRNNILLYLKKLIDSDVIIEGQICNVVLEESTAMASYLFSNREKICEIISVNKI